MAKGGIIQNLFTFETGGSLLFRGVESAPFSGGGSTSLVTTPAPPNPTYENYCLKCDVDIKDNIWTSPSITTSGLMILGVYVRFDFLPLIDNGKKIDFIEIKSGGSTDWILRYIDVTPAPDPPGGGSAMRLQLVEADGTVTDHDFNVFTQDTWHLVEVVWSQGNSNAIRVFIDGNQSFFQSSVDLQGGGGDISIDLQGQLNATGTNTFFKNCYIMSDSVNFLSKLGATAVKAYRIGETGITPDCDQLGSTSSLHDLDGGAWDDLSDDNDTSVAFYSDLSDAGGTVCNDTNTDGVPGPSNDDFKWNSEILGAKWCWRMASGTGTLANVIYGYKTGSTHIVTDVGTAKSRIHNFTVFNEHGQIPTRIPGVDEDFILGFKKNAISANNVFCRSAWAILWFKPTILTNGTTTVQINGGKILGGKIK